MKNLILSFLILTANLALSSETKILEYRFINNTEMRELGPVLDVQVNGEGYLILGFGETERNKLAKSGNKLNRTNKLFFKLSDQDIDDLTYLLSNLEGISIQRENASSICKIFIQDKTIDTLKVNNNVILNSEECWNSTKIRPISEVNYFYAQELKFKLIELSNSLILEL